jgi:Ser/Thr protein kinase RdoA (MazF antagonist)
MIKATGISCSRAADRLGRNSSLALLDGAQVKVTTAIGAEAEALRRLATLLQRLQELPQIPFRLPSVIDSRPAGSMDGHAWTVIRKFIPGQDLTRHVSDADTTLTSQRIGAVGHAVGAELGRLHRASTIPAVRNLSHGRFDELAEEWLRASSDHFRVLTTRVAAATQIGSLSREVLAMAQNAIRILRARLTDELTRPEAANPCLIHGDAHGGNIIIAFEPDTELPTVRFIDEQLVVGDAIFDVASVQSWALEVLPEHLLSPFLCDMGSGYRAQAPGLTTSHATLSYCHALRALGRLAYYARSNPRWVEPYGPARLVRQVATLARLAADDTSGAARVDPMSLPWRELPDSHHIPEQWEVFP